MYVKEQNQSCEKRNKIENKIKLTHKTHMATIHSDDMIVML